MRPVLIPGNLVEAEIRSKSEAQLPFARLELLTSRGPWLGEPLPAAAIAWTTALTAIALPENHAYPALYDALSALLDAICHAPSARGWAPGLLSYEALLLRELGYGAGRARLVGAGASPPPSRPDGSDWPALMAYFDRIGAALTRYLLADRRGDVMGTRNLLRQRLARIGSD